jgi:hypothetical protein
VVSGRWLFASLRFIIANGATADELHSPSESSKTARGRLSAVTALLGRHQAAWGACDASWVTSKPAPDHAVAKLCTASYTTRHRKACPSSSQSGGKSPSFEAELGEPGGRRAGRYHLAEVERTAVGDAMWTAFMFVCQVAAIYPLL